MNLVGNKYKLITDFKSTAKNANLLKDPKINSEPFLKWLLNNTNIVNRFLDERSLKIFVQNLLEKHDYKF